MSASPADHRGAESSLTRLRLYNFRNYPHLELELGPGLNLFVGENAQGKTNLLEAVATLLLTRSPRAGSASELLRWGTDQAAVDGVLVGHSASETVSLRLRRLSEAEPGKAVGDGSSHRISRTTSTDGNPIRPRDLIGRWPIVLFWPDDLHLVKAGPEARRHLLDVLVSQIDRQAADDLIRYRRVLEQRNALLRRLRRAGGGSPDHLSPFDDALVRHGASVQVARAALVRALAPLAAAAAAEISGSRDALEIVYAPRSGAPGAEHSEAMASLREALNRSRSEEMTRGMTVVGPHRDDVEYRVNGRSARTSASQGQQRSAVLATKIAEVRLLRSRSGRTPIVLLDDVLSELDPGRRQRLLAALSAAGEAAQTLVTCSDKGQLDGEPLRLFQVLQATVSRA